MKLRTKLFLSVGILLIFVAAAMFFFSDYLVKRDVTKASERIQGLLSVGRKELHRSAKEWVKREFEWAEGRISTLLTFIQESPEIAKKLTSSNPEVVWEMAASLPTYNPEIGLVQVSDGETVVILAKEGTVYSAVKLPVQDPLTWILLQNVKGEPLEHLYVGIPYQEEFYALIPWEEMDRELPEVTEMLRESRMEEIDVHGKKQVLLQILAPLFARGLELPEQDEEKIPAGIAEFKEGEKQGFALLSAEVFRETPFVPEAQADGALIIKDPQSQELFLAKTLSLDGAEVLLGIGLGDLFSKIALVSNRTILFSDGKGNWVGFNPKGLPIPEQQIKEIAAGREIEKVTLMDQFEIYVFLPRQQEKLILPTINELGKKLSGRIFFQMLLVCIVSLAIALLILSRIAAGIVRPLSKLAEATEEISEGKYSEIALPEVGKRKDEIATLAKAFGDMVHGLEEREKIRAVLNKVVSKDVADEILKSQIHLGGEDRVISMLFSDIRDFTKLTEKEAPQKIIAELNEYMTKMSRVIEGEGGVIDKYVGDEIMALYGAPTTHPDHALRAVSSAMLMLETLRKWNLEKEKSGEHPIEMGIGVHTGLVVVGNMGAEDRLNYTVLGANVNLAARLCQVAGPGQIIISEQTLKEPNVEDSFFIKPLESITLKGFSEPIKIYQVEGFKWG